jgi:diguanylate cyclase (GGDEF)-like protein
MKIDDTKPRAPLTKVGARDGSRGASAQGAAATPSSPPAGDVATVLGIPAAELTPKVQTAITGLMEEVNRLRRELATAKERLAEIEHDANHDPLVPVLNRRAFVREMSRLLSFTERYNMPASVVYFDLNDFKNLNDNFGHAAGDTALLHVGALLSANVRESDLVGRLGGDEFGVILANANEDVALKKAESLVQLINSSPITMDGKSVPLSVAYGIYQFKGGEDARAAIANADQAMFVRKRMMKKNPKNGSTP